MLGKARSALTLSTVFPQATHHNARLLCAQNYFQVRQSFPNTTGTCPKFVTQDRNDRPNAPSDMQTPSYLDENPILRHIPHQSVLRKTWSACVSQNAPLRYGVHCSAIIRITQDYCETRHDRPFKNPQFLHCCTHRPR